jgi:CheY-like chemotaxis protein
MAAYDLAGVHVLIVEDIDESREALRLLLEYCGALVTAAGSAEDAKRILREVRPHVLLTDIGMPDDGLELIREVRTFARTQGVHIPAIALTAYQGRREELLAEGFVELLEKPVDPRTLCSVVRQRALIQA